MNNKLKYRHFYTLHRDNEKDHEFGRPVLLLNYRLNECLVWIGTTKIDNKNKEEPLILSLNKIKTYFYANNIKPVATNDLKSEWIDYKTNQTCVLSFTQQKEIIKKFISFSQLTNPYYEIDYLKEVIKIQKFEKNELQKQNENLKLQQEKLNLENEKLTLEKNTLTKERDVLKMQRKIKIASEYE